MKPDEARQPQNHLRRLRLLRVLRIFHDIQLLCGKMSKNELSKIAKEENLFRSDDTMVSIGPIKKNKNKTGLTHYKMKFCKRVLR